MRRWLVAATTPKEPKGDIDMDQRHFEKLFFLLQLHEKVLGYPKMAKTRAMIEAQLAEFESAQDAPKADPAPAIAPTPARADGVPSPSNFTPPPRPLKLDLGGHVKDGDNGQDDSNG